MARTKKKSSYSNADKEWYAIHPRNFSQQLLMESIRHNKVTIAIGSAGTGKLNPNDTPVLTPNGYVRLDSLEVGDQVIARDGSPTKVLGVYPKENLEIYKLTFTDGSTVECCIDHLWAVRTPKEVVNNRPFKVKSLRELLPKIPRKRTDSKKSNYYEIPLVEPIQFEEKILPVDPYILGCILGDGSIRSNGYLQFTTGLQDYSYFSGIFKPYVNTEKRYGNVYQLRGNQLKQQLVNLGLAGKTRNDKFVPDAYLYGSIQQRTSLLQGLLDTDGCINKKGNKIRFSNNNIKLVEAVKWLVQSLGGVTAIHKEKRADHYYLNISLPNSVKAFRLPRKDIQNRTNAVRRKIVSAEYVGQKDGRCIMVEHSEHLFCLNDCIVTHNTLISLYEACKLYRQGKVDKIYYLRNDVGMKGLGSIPRGALPGDEFEKARHLLHPIMDNIGDVMNYNKAKFMIENRIIEPIIFDDIRGRSLSNCFILADELQNCPPSGVLTVLTRLDRTCKIVLSGDPGQKDSTDKYKDGLSHAAKVLSDLDFVGAVYFTDGDIERDPCNTEIIKRYRNSQV